MRSSLRNRDSYKLMPLASTCFNLFSPRCKLLFPMSFLVCILNLFVCLPDCLLYLLQILQIFESRKICKICRKYNNVFYTQIRLFGRFCRFFRFSATYSRWHSDRLAGGLAGWLGTRLAGWLAANSSLPMVGRAPLAIGGKGISSPLVGRPLHRHLVGGASHYHWWEGHPIAIWWAWHPIGILFCFEYYKDSIRIIYEDIIRIPYGYYDYISMKIL